MLLKTNLCLLYFIAYISRCEGKSHQKGTVNVNLKLETKYDPTCKVASHVTVLKGDSVTLKVEGYFIRYTKFTGLDWNRDLEFKRVNREKLKFFSEINEVKGGSWNVTFWILENHNYNYGHKSVVYYKGNNYTYITCLFDVHVRRDDVLSVSINNVTLPTALADVRSDHDASTKYEYIRGEMAHISCTKMVHWNGLIILNYKHVKQETGHGQSTVSMRAKLRPEANNSFIQCDYPSQGRDWSRLRVYLVPKAVEQTQDIGLSFRVNGVILRDSVLNNFHYHNEIMNIDCDRNDQSYGTFRWDYDNTYCSRINDIESKTSSLSKRSSVVCPPRNGDQIKLECIYKTDKGDEWKKKLIINQDVDEAFYVTGLTDTNILFVYDKVQTTIIEYEYTKPELLKLVCKTNKHALIKRQQNTIETIIDWTNNAGVPTTNNTKNMISVLVDETFSTELMCVVKAKISSVMPTLKKIQIRMVHGDARPEEDITEKPIEVPVSPSRPQHLEDEAGDLSKYLQPLIIGALCIFVVIMMSTILAVRINHRKRENKRDSSITYENLASSNECRNLPHPVQWNENHYVQPVDLRQDTETYSVPYKPTLEDLYSKPMPKKQRNDGPEAMYAEVGCSNNYAQVAPKSQRKQTANDHYAELVLKMKDKDGGYVNTVNQESPYAEISQYTKYENVFPNSRNGNENATEYAEPAYCEVSKKYNN